MPDFFAEPVSTLVPGTKVDTDSAVERDYSLRTTTLPIE
ncbi:hypothetical protein FHS03_000152 [Massilia violacea]|uniref:Uncharacterized protein n=1 Tax=Pseudoduganella violacea TaxID=1715466 RepID=A0A7W5B5U3_9BURK|nr:hypothetical protein [Pseudoduganella violacea]